MKLRLLKGMKTEQQRDQEFVLDQMRERLRQMRVRAPKRPRNEDGSLLDPHIPADITQLQDERLGRIHSQFASMAQYALFQVSLRSVEHSIAKRMDRLSRARVRLEKSGTNDDKAAKVEMDSRTRKSSLELLVGEGGERLTQAVLDGYLIGRDLCSREMTRRMNTNR